MGWLQWFSSGNYVCINDRLDHSRKQEHVVQRRSSCNKAVNQPPNLRDRGWESRLSQWTILTPTPLFISWRRKEADFVNFFASLQEINVSFQTQSQTLLIQETNNFRNVKNLWTGDVHVTTLGLSQLFLRTWIVETASQPLTMVALRLLKSQLLD